MSKPPPPDIPPKTSPSFKKSHSDASVVSYTDYTFTLTQSFVCLLSLVQLKSAGLSPEDTELVDCEEHNDS